MIPDANVRQAMASVCRRGVPLTRAELAEELLLSEDGLRKHHKRRGLSWPEFLARARGTVPPVSLCRVGLGVEDCCMTSVQIRLDPDVVEDLKALARHERRTPRDQAAYILEAEIRRRRLPRRIDQRRPAA